jgi:diguanylate cyclase (GGDEF)-like protein
MLSKRHGIGLSPISPTARSANISLSWMLTVPFILQVVAVVSWVGYLSYENGHRSVETLTDQLMTATGHQVEQTLTSYLATPQLANQAISDALKRDEFDLSQLDRDRVKWAQFLWQEMQVFPQFSWISLGNEQGDAMGAWRPGPTAPLQLSISNRSTQYFGTYHTIESGQLGKVLKVEKPAFDPRTRPWYKDAIAAQGQPMGQIWTPIYAGFTPGTIFVAASMPLYDRQNQFVGVSGIDLSLNNIQTFLSQIPVSRNSQIFLMERSGLLVSSSSQESPFRRNEARPERPPDHPPDRLNAMDSATELIRTTSRSIREKTAFEAIREPEKFHFRDHQTRFVKVIPFHNGKGLDWLIVIVVPEEDVMGQIHQGTSTTIGLGLAAVVLVIGINSLISRHLARPIIGLSRASQRITQGDFSTQIHPSHIHELSTLAQSFQQMSQEIQQSRHQLEDYSKSLEQKVSDRTQELQGEIERRAAIEHQLHNANHQLQELAYRDGLTQIANRRRFDEVLHQEWSRLQRDRQPLALILCDVDYFKPYNDSYGHQEGDDCLRAVAAAIASSVRRPSDLATRYGGEEFAVILPNTDRLGAIAVANRIRALLHSLEIPHRASLVSPHVTLSFGIASQIPIDSATPEELLERADKALYEAKRDGRDRIGT